MNKTFTHIALSSLAAFALAAGLAQAQTAQTAQTVQAASPACQAALKAKIALNTAPLARLECLPGVSKMVAADLIKERPFKSERDFLNRIEGGRKLWTGISPYVVLK